jgi:hypothetical protein
MPTVVVRDHTRNNLQFYGFNIWIMPLILMKLEMQSKCLMNLCSLSYELKGVTF